MVWPTENLQDPSGLAKLHQGQSYRAGKSLTTPGSVRLSVSGPPGLLQSGLSCNGHRPGRTQLLEVSHGNVHSFLSHQQIVIDLKSFHSDKTKKVTTLLILLLDTRND